MHSQARRHFLRLGAQTLAGAGLALGADPHMTLARAADSTAIDHGDYRALVCVFLRGGCDGFSLMVPTDRADYNAYARSRSHLAVPAAQLLALGGRSANQRAAGLHPSAEALLPLYDEGRLAMIANIGNLVEPVTRESINEGTARVPEQLFSHSDQYRQWQQLQGKSNTTVGWGALASEHLNGFQEHDYLTSITLAGANYWQVGAGSRPYSLKSSGLVQHAGLDADKTWQKPRRDAFERVLAHRRSHLMVKEYADIQRRAIQITAELGEALEASTPAGGETPPDSGLAQQLAMVAQLIGARSVLGLRRQIYYVSMGGFDVHDHQNLEMPQLLGELSRALAFFQRRLDTLGEGGNVITFTASDFGRALSSNGDGTDHGWGNHLMALGDPVRGGMIHGNLPLLDMDGPDSINNGRIVPTTGASQYAASLLGWLGLDESQLHAVLPDLVNFGDRRLDIIG